jgi:hypothetical protein
LYIPDLVITLLQSKLNCTFPVVEYAVATEYVGVLQATPFTQILKVWVCPLICPLNVMMALFTLLIPSGGLTVTLNVTFVLDVMLAW